MIMAKLDKNKWMVTNPHSIIVEKDNSLSIIVMEDKKKPKERIK